MRKILISLVALFLSVNAQEVYTNFSVEAEKSANLAFDAGGIVNNVFVDVSSIVKKGDKLVELQNNDLKASLKVAKATLEIEKSNVKDAEVSLKFAKKDYERQLKIKDIIDDARFDSFALVYEKAIVAVQKAKAAVQKAEVNLAYQQSLLDKTILYAPFDGIIFEKSVEVGDVVSSMSLRTVFKIQSLTNRNLILEFDQKYWKIVKVGQNFKYTVDGNKKVYNGVISKVYPFADNGNRKIKAEVKTKGFVVGLFGEGYINIQGK